MAGHFLDVVYVRLRQPFVHVPCEFEDLVGLEVRDALDREPHTVTLGQFGRLDWPQYSVLKDRLDRALHAASSDRHTLPRRRRPLRARSHRTPFYLSRKPSPRRPRSSHSASLIG